jgi:hypothetical protein
MWRSDESTANIRHQLSVLVDRRLTLGVTQHLFVDTMSHALDHALRNAPPNKPHPPWLQQLQAQWQATKHALGSTRGPNSRPASVDGVGGGGKGTNLRRRSSLHSLGEALLQTKDALLAAIGMLPRKHATEPDDSCPYKILGDRM